MTTTFAFNGTVVVVLEVEVVVVGVVGVSLHPARNKIKIGIAMRENFLMVPPFQYSKIFLLNFG